MEQPRIISDLHTHTVFSHGKGTPEENVLAAIRCGLRRVAVSEHAGGHVFYGVRGEKLLRLRREIDRLAAKYANRIEVLMGYECNLAGFGLCDAPKERSMFDVLLLAYHKGVVPRDSLGRAMMREALGLGRADPVAVANALLAAAETYRIDIFSHPGAYVKADITTLAKGAKELGAMLELNGSRVTLSPEEARTAYRLGAKLCVNSDAHTPARVGDFAAGLELAWQAGVPVDEWKL
jgi:putative hydrolase